MTTEPSASSTAEPKTGGTLIFARNAEPATFNPLGPSDNGSIWAQMQIFDQLVEQVPDSPDPQPALATSWDVSPDGTSYTFHLRQVKFSNGDPMTAEDVKFSLDRFADPKINTGYSNLAASVKDVVIVDPATVRVDLNRVDALFLNTMTMFIASIVPQKVVSQIGEEKFGDSPVGTGPFMLKSWTRGQSVELVRNPNYWKPGRPHLDGVTFLFIQDDNTRILKIQSGEAQVAESIPVSQVDQLNKTTGVKVLVEPLASIVSVYLNNSIKPLDDKLVRQALNYATPKDALLNTVWFGEAQIANSMIPAVKFWDKTIPPYPYDLDKAKQLMAQSSSPNGFTLPLLITSGDVIEQQTGTILQTEWAKIGVKVQIQSLDLGSMFTKYFGGDFTSAVFPGNVITSDVLVDDELASIILDYNGGSKSFYTNYNSPAASKLIHDANSTLDNAQRQQLFSQLQKLTMDDAPQVPLLFTPARTAIRDTVNGFRTIPTGWWKLEDVWLSQ